MLSKSDIDLTLPMRELSSFGIEGAYLVPTATGLGKSILDAHASLRNFLVRSGVHDYELQGQGPKNKTSKQALILTRDGWVNSTASLYRPSTKNGDPRIWFSRLRDFVVPNNLLVVLVYEGTLFVVNASDRNLWGSVRDQTSPFGQLIAKMSTNFRTTQESLLQRVNELSAVQHRSTTNADSGVGDTLENLLGISRNSKKTPDYHGIEIKAKRIGGKGGSGKTVKSSLFSLAPNWAISKAKNAREILDIAGYVSSSTGRRALQVTVGSAPNSQGLYLLVQSDRELVRNQIAAESEEHDVVCWRLPDLETTLLEKHASTCWVGAKSEIKGNWEYFQYIRAEITTAPLVSNFRTLIESGIVTLDFTISEKEGPTGLRTRDHGYLWRISEVNRALLFPPGQMIEFDAP